MPSHWAAIQLRRTFDIVNGGTPPVSNEDCWDGDTAWLTPDDLGRNNRKFIGQGQRNITSEGIRTSSARLSPAHSVLLSTRAPIGHLAITEVPAASNQGCRTLVPLGPAQSEFAYYALLASRDVLQAAGKGSTFMELSASDLAAHRLPSPPVDEQRSINAYLDRETARIDSLILMQELLVERLDEHRMALVTRVVTKGLPPVAAGAAGLDTAPTLKDSGVDWLGKVPANWKVLHLRHVCRFAYGDSLRLEDREQGEIPVYGSNGRVGFHSEANTSAPVIIVGRKGSHGKVNYEFGTAFAIDTTYFVDESCTTSDLRWLYYALLSADLADVSKDAAVPGLSREDAYAKYLPLPPLAEQRAIGEYLDVMSERIDALRAKAELSIERLSEYRSAVIAAAVTGKIDVREAELAGAGGGA
ncbi:MAG: restriction endonuclease subunit S [Acidimicrobiaceae bacterium]|nr:restriction endonuclease subunit S [Acidimicrobiaceae bacterium]